MKNFSHKLGRQVWVLINPAVRGTGSVGLRPNLMDDAGLTISIQFGVELTGVVNPDTGLIVNVTDIDDKVCEHIVPILNKKISETFQANRRVDLLETISLLKLAWQSLYDKFAGQADLNKLTMVLNPLRKIWMDCEDKNMVYLSEKFDFAATHKLWNDQFSEQQNYEIFGKCANPSGHGHNYCIEVVVKAPAQGIKKGWFNDIIEKHLLGLIDHKNLNLDVPFFAKTIPTVENIAIFAWKTLENQLFDAKLHCITVWETQKTYCSYYGPQK